MDAPEPGEGAGPPERARRRPARLGTVACLAAVVLAVDQLTKHWALNRLSDGSIIEVVGSLQFRLTFNTGTAFSLGSGRNLGPYIAVLALVVVGWLLWSGHSASRPGAVAAGLVAGGAVGNLVDRALRAGPWGTDAGFMGGAVVDFIDLQWWPVFNVADAGIVLGALALVVASFFEPRPAEG